MVELSAGEWLVEQVREGNEEAWRELIARFAGRLFAFVESRLRNRSISEDIVQDTFVGLLTALPNYDARTPLESFLFAIAAHKLTDHLRRTGRRPTVPLLWDEGSSEPAGKQRVASSLMRSRERHDQAAAFLRETLAEVVGACRDRGDFERLQCLELLFLRGLPNKHAAQVLGISEQAVANHKLACVSKLKEKARRAGLNQIRWGD